MFRSTVIKGTEALSWASWPAVGLRGIDAESAKSGILSSWIVTNLPAFSLHLHVAASYCPAQWWQVVEKGMKKSVFYSWPSLETPSPASQGKAFYEMDDLGWLPRQEMTLFPCKNFCAHNMHQSYQVQNGDLLNLLKTGLLCIQESIFLQNVSKTLMYEKDGHPTKSYCTKPKPKAEAKSLHPETSWSTSGGTVAPAMQLSDVRSKLQILWRSKLPESIWHFKATSSSNIFQHVPTFAPWA